MKRFLSLTLAALMLLAIGCASTTPAQETSEVGDLFDQLAETEEQAKERENNTVMTDAKEQETTAAEEASVSEDRWLAFAKAGNHSVLIDETGEIITPLKYKHIWLFSEIGLARIETDDGEFGYINSNGEMVISVGYDGATDFGGNGLAVVARNNRIEIINDTGVCLATKELSEVSNTLSGILYAKNGLSAFYADYIKEKMGYMNEKGEIVIAPKFTCAMDFNDNGLALVRGIEDDKYGFIDANGEYVIAPQFNDAGPSFSCGMTWVKIDGKFGYINESGKIVIAPQFDRAYRFAENGMAVVVINKKYGYINEQGEVVIPATYQYAWDYSVNGLAPVLIDGLYGFINGIGEMVITAQFTKAYSFSDNGLAYVEMNGKSGFINELGEFVIPLQTTWTASGYAYAGCFEKVKGH